MKKIADPIERGGKFMASGINQSATGSRPVPKVEAVRLEDVVSRLETAIWLYDFEACRIVWANEPALRLWEAETPEDLTTRDMYEEMSESVRTRLRQHYEDFERNPSREIREFWTLYPNDTPFRVQAILRRHVLSNGRIAMLVEARPEEIQQPETIRSADALLHADMIVGLFSRNGRELYSNPAFRSAFGPGEHIFENNFASPFDYLEIQEGLEESGEHRITAQVHTVHGKRWHFIHAIRCRDPHTGDGAFLISATDVTDSREQQQQLKEANETAQDAVRMKSQFLAAMSHEMRTPLNGILGMGSVLASSELSEEQQKQVSLINASGLDMLDLVDNVLELVSIDSDPVVLKKEPFDLGYMVTAVISEFEDKFLSKGLRVITNLPTQKGFSYEHDASRISQVLRHLISNAIKFTSRGSIYVRAELSGETGLSFEVADSGIGIAREHRDRVFERFYQADSSSIREFGGSGIGLSICKELVETWEGQISVQSEPGRGSIFQFTVPGSVKPRSALAAPASGGKPRYLRVVASETDQEA